MASICVHDWSTLFGWKDSHHLCRLAAGASHRRPPSSPPHLPVQVGQLPSLTPSPLLPYDTLRRLHEMSQQQPSGQPGNPPPPPPFVPDCISAVWHFGEVQDPASSNAYVFQSPQIARFRTTSLKCTRGTKRTAPSPLFHSRPMVVIYIFDGLFSPLPPNNCMTVMTESFPFPQAVFSVYGLESCSTTTNHMAVPNACIVAHGSQSQSLPNVEGENPHLCSAK